MGTVPRSLFVNGFVGGGVVWVLLIFFVGLFHAYSKAMGLIQGFFLFNKIRT